MAGTSLLFLAVLGALAARVGGAKLLPAAIRVLFWGALAMAVTAGVGALFGTVVCRAMGSFRPSAGGEWGPTTGLRSEVHA